MGQGREERLEAAEKAQREEERTMREALEAQVIFPLISIVLRYYSPVLGIAGRVDAARGGGGGGAAARAGGRRLRPQARRVRCRYRPGGAAAGTSCCGCGGHWVFLRGGRLQMHVAGGGQGEQTEYSSLLTINSIVCLQGISIKSYRVILSH